MVAPLWRLSQQISNLTIADFGAGVSAGLEESILNSQIDLLTKALQNAEQLQTLSFICFSYPHKSQGQERYQRFLKDIIPSLVRIPKIESLTPPVGPFKQVYYSMQQLHPQVEALSIRKHLLEASDIKQLGKTSSEEKDHPLSCLSRLLEDDEVAERIVKEWNEKYAPS
jgi:hypothetical protein